MRPRLVVTVMLEMLGMQRSEAAGSELNQLPAYWFKESAGDKGEVASIYLSSKVATRLFSVLYTFCF
jgi:hypothetical protein